MSIYCLSTNLLNLWAIW